MFPRAIWILFAGTFINRFGSFVLVFLILHLTREGYSAAEAGAAVSGYGLGAMAASVLGGHLADRLGRRAAIAISMFSAAAVIMALASARSLPLIIALTAAMGLTAELYRPASSALLMDLTRPGERVLVFAGYRLAINLGAAIGPALGGLVAERSFLWLYWGDALTCLVFGVIALVALPPGVRTARAEEPPGQYRSLLRDQTFMLFLAASTLGAFVYAQAHSGFALEVSARGLSSAIYGGLIALNGLIVLILELPLASITRRYPARPVIALGMLLVGIGFGMTGIAPGVTMLGVAVFVWTLGEIVAAPVASAYVAELAPERMRGRYQGAWTLTFGLGLVLGPAVGGWLFSQGAAWLWWGCLAAGLAAAVLVLASGRGARRGAEPSTTAP